jgi:hypothetical protein
MRQGLRRGGLGVVLAAALATAPTATAAAVDADAKLPDRVAFGDPVELVVLATVDPQDADPGSLALGSGQGPYRVVRSQRSPATDVGGRSRVELRAALECLVEACLPGVARRATVVLAYRSTDGRRQQLEVKLPETVVAGRVTPDELAGHDFREPVQVPDVAYRVPPELATAALAAVALALFALAAWLGPWRPRRRAAPASPAGRAMTLEEAIAGVRAAAADADVRQRRRALDGLLMLLPRSAQALRGRTRRLAWRREQPDPDGMRAVADEASAAERERA